MFIVIDILNINHLTPRWGEHKFVLSAFDVTGYTRLPVDIKIPTRIHVYNPVEV